MIRTHCNSFPLLYLSTLAIESTLSRSFSFYTNGSTPLMQLLILSTTPSLRKAMKIPIPPGLNGTKSSVKQTRELVFAKTYIQSLNPVKMSFLCSGNVSLKAKDVQLSHQRRKTF